MNAPHTPGPWAVSHTGMIVYDAAGGWLADARTVQRASSEDKANARLIAAAPDLLAACKRLLVEVRWEAARADVVTDEARADIALAEAAIAKATGVAP